MDAGLSGTDWVLLSLVAALAGAFGSLFGIGGGIVLVPILIAFFGIDTELARSASLVAVSVTSMAGSLVYLREGVTDLDSASFLQLPTAIGAVLGALLGGVIDPRAIKIGFACVILFVSYRLIRHATLKPRTGPPTKSEWGFVLLACLSAGILSSLLGVGGGLVFVPTLTMLLHRGARESSATSTYLIGLTGAASALIYAKAGHMDYALTAPVALGILIGAQVGARVSKHIPAQKLSYAFAGVMVVNAVLLVNKAVQGA